MIPTITEAQRSQFAEEGYFLLENVFTMSEMDALAEQIETYQRRHEERLAQVGAEGISRAGEISFTDHIAEKDEYVRAFVTRPEFVAITTQLLGDDIDLYWNQSVFKGPDGTKEFPWHQDDGYTPVEPSPYLTLWLALNDATTDNGCISVLPGSHKKGLVPHTPSPIGLVCHPAEDPNQGVQLPVPAGSIGVFSSLTMHKSGVNRTHGIRKAYIVQYAHAGLKDALTGKVFEDNIPIVRQGLAAATPVL